MSFNTGCVRAASLDTSSRYGKYYPFHAGGTAPQNSFFFAFSGAQKQGTQFFLRPTTLLAISWPVDGVRGRLNVPSNLTLPCASIGYLILALQRALAELGPSTRCKFPANFLQISCKFPANFGATPALGIISCPHRPPAH